MTIGATNHGIELGMQCALPELSVLESSAPEAALAFHGLVAQKGLRVGTADSAVMMSFDLAECAATENGVGLSQLATFVDGMTANSNIDDDNLSFLSLGTNRGRGLMVAANIRQPLAPFEHVSGLVETAMSSIAEDIGYDGTVQVQVRPHKLRLNIDKYTTASCYAKLPGPESNMRFNSSGITSRKQQFVALAGLLVVAKADQLVTS